jgi:hypothetical protein
MNNLEINNPGNIRPGGNWRGEIGERNGFARFATMLDGAEAIGKQLRVYVEGRRKAKPCIGYLDDEGEWQGLIPIWAPPKENRTILYIGYVCKRLDILDVNGDPDGRALLPMRDLNALWWLTCAIGEFEQGSQKFHGAVSDDLISAAAKAATEWPGPR